MARLRNEKYAGTMVYNQTSGKLKTPKHPNPPEEWVRTPEAFSGVIDFELYLQAQEILDKRKQRYDPDYMLRMLDKVHLITDSGRTEFHGQPTRTCIAIGPDDTSKIDQVTRHLELL